MNRQPTHGTTIAAPSHTMGKSRPPIARRISDATDCGLMLPSSGSRLTSAAGATTAAGVGSASDNTDGVTTSSTFADACWTMGLRRQACQPARMLPYWDLGTNLDEAFLI